MSNATIRTALHWKLFLGAWLGFAMASQAQHAAVAASQPRIKKDDHVSEGRKISGEQTTITRQSTINFSDLAAREASEPPRKISKKKPRSESLRYLRENMVASRGSSRTSSTSTKSAPQGNDLTATKSPAPLALAVAAPEALAAALPSSPPPSASFLGLLTDGTDFNPDTQGAVGPNHLMVALNTSVAVQNRAGGIIQSVSLEAFWASTGATN